MKVFFISVVLALVANVGSAPFDASPSVSSCPKTPGTKPVYIADPDDCTKYTVCSGSFGMKLDCPPGLHFNKNTSACDYPPNAGCEDIATEDPTKLKGAPGIKKDAYMDVDDDGLPKPVTAEPKPGIGQLSDTGFVDEQASKGDDAAASGSEAGAADPADSAGPAGSSAPAAPAGHGGSAGAAAPSGPAASVGSAGPSGPSGPGASAGAGGPGGAAGHAGPAGPGAFGGLAPAA